MRESERKLKNNNNIWVFDQLMYVVPRMKFKYSHDPNYRFFSL